jgi:hypothetical protein
MNNTHIVLIRPFSRFRDAVQDSPAGHLTQAKALAAAMDEALELYRARLREIGLAADGSDHAYRLEAAMYDFARRSNPASGDFFAVAEGYGAAVQGPARERVIAQTRRDAEFLAPL